MAIKIYLQGGSKCEVCQHCRNTEWKDFSGIVEHKNGRLTFFAACTDDNCRDNNGYQQHFECNKVLITAE